MTEQRQHITIPGGPTPETTRPGLVLSLDTIRLVAQPLNTDKNDADLPTNHGWSISIEEPHTHVDGSTRYVMLGDYVMSAGLWFVGTTSRLIFSTPEVAQGNAPDIKEIVDRYAEWGAHLLWHQAITSARVAASQCLEAHRALGAIPTMMPDAHIVLA